MSFADDSSDEDWYNKKSDSKTNAGRSSSKDDFNSSGSRPKYSQRFCDKWLDIFKPWLARCDDDANKPFCRACQTRLDCNRCHLQRHERTSKHARNLEILVHKGEGAARQNLSIRQERSKYYQQRKKIHTDLDSPPDTSDIGMEGVEDYIEEADQDPETFQFVQTEAAPGDQYSEESILKQEVNSADGTDPSHQPIRSVSHKNLIAVRSGPQKIIKKERMKLLMQIQKDKNDLMDSFKDIMYTHQQSPREKNHVDLFFESVSSSVQALSPKLIAEAKMRVSQLICELELRGLTENDVKPGGSGATASVVLSSATDGVSGTYIINQSVGVMHDSENGSPHEMDEQHHYE